MALHLCSKMNFPSGRQFSQEILLLLEDKIKYFYVLPMLVECHSIMPILIFECPKGHMMCTLGHEFFWEMISNQTCHCWLD
jgi:hypothetical protein